MSGSSNTPLECVAHLHDDKWQKCAQDIRTLISENPDYDDGSYGPLLIRLAWHAAGTYDKNTGTGGSDGATMRYAPEDGDGANAGLHIARQLMERIKGNHPWITYADLWILASYVAIEASNGPVIAFSPGRQDIRTGSLNKQVPENGMLPDAAPSYTDKQKTIDHIRWVFKDRMGFNDQEIVALVVGGHAYGRCHTDRSGFNGPWTSNPTKFTNVYAKRLLDDEWKLISHESAPSKCPIAPKMGNQQYVNKNGEGNLMMLVSDMAFLWDASFKEWVEVYAKDGKMLKTDFGVVYKRLTELGCNSLVSSSSRL